MRVIIVGGGIAGLTLAGALENANIDFVLLEARAVLDPQVGASIGLGAASMRILDQLGAAQEIIDNTVPVKLSRMHRSDGSLLAPPSTAFQLVKARFGYGVNFLDRQIVLRAIARSVKSKHNMLVNKVVCRTEHTDSGVVVHCEDGTAYPGEIIAGCDGVNSKASIRSEMFRLAAKVDPQYFPENEATKMKAEYICLFGISNPVEGLEEGDVDNVFDTGRSFLVMTGKNRRVFWFYTEKLDRSYHYHAKDYPRYSKLEAEKLAHDNAWRHCTETLTLGDLWKTRVSYSLVPLEEALFERWSWGRMATVGDNAHKMTPNTGQAGNNAVESAAALANHLKALIDSGGVFTLDRVTRTLTSWQKKRQARIAKTCTEAAAICRLQALDSAFARFTTNWLLPHGAEFLLDLVTNTLLGAEVLEYLPVPDRSFEGSCPFNPRQGTGQQESLLRRSAVAAPLLLFAFHGATTSAIPGLFQSAEVRPDAILSMPQLLTVAELGLAYSIILIESYRRANKTNILRAAVLFGMLGGYVNPDAVAPVYFFTHYVFSPVERFAADDMRLTDVAYTRTILPLLVLSMGGFAYAHTLVDLDQLAAWLVLAPVLLWLVQWMLVKIGLSKSTLFADALSNCRRDLPHIRSCIYVLGTGMAATWLFEATLLAVASSTDDLQRVFWRILSSQYGAVHVAGVFWIWLLVNDLKAAGMVRSGWLKIMFLGLVAGLVGGPVLVAAVGWLWREEILASRKEKHAITREKYGGKTYLEVANQQTESLA